MTSQVRAVRQAAPVGTLVVTVGGSPVPVLLAMLALRPERVIAIHTAQSRPVWQRVEELYRRWLRDDEGHSEAPTQDLSVDEFEVAPHSADDTVVALASLDGVDPWSLAYAGGTPTMSAAAFGEWWRKHGAAVDSGRLR